MTDEAAELQGEVLPEENTGEAAQIEDSATSEAEEATRDDSPADAEKPKAKGVQKRIDELTELRRNAERDRDYWRELALQPKDKPQEAPKPQPQGKPSLDQFESYDGYLEALSDWKVDQRLQAERQQTQEREQQATQQQREYEFSLRVQTFAETHPDFDSVVRNPSLPITQEMVEVAQSSDKGPEVLYHLGQNPEEAHRISQLSPLQQALELGRLEVSLSRPSRTQTGAPPPIEPVSGTGGNESVDPERMTPDEWMAWRNKQLAR